MSDTGKLWRNKGGHDTNHLATFGVFFGSIRVNKTKSRDSQGIEFKINDWAFSFLKIMAYA